MTRMKSSTTKAPGKKSLDPNSGETSSQSVVDIMGSGSYDFFLFFPSIVGAVTEDNLVLGSEVVRGRDWDHGNVDGGAGKRGVLQMSWLSGARVAVKWIESGDDTHHYRIGYGGKYDLNYAICGTP